MTEPSFDCYYAGTNPYFKTSATGMLVDFLRSNAGRGMCALDLGCGNGRNTVAIADAGYYCVGLDKSHEALLAFCSTFTIKKKKASLIRADARQLPFYDETFSLIFCGTVLSCLELHGVHEAIRECWRCSQPGASLVLTDFSTADPGASSSYPRDDASECAQQTKTYFSRDMLSSLLDKLFELRRLWHTSKLDTSHGKPHRHALVRLVARRS